MRSKISLIMILVWTLLFTLGMTKCINTNGENDYLSITKGLLYTTKTTIETAEKAFAEYYETTANILLDQVEAGVLSKEDYKQKKLELLTRPKEQIASVIEKAREIHNSAVIILFEIEPLIELAQSSETVNIELNKKKLELGQLITNLNTVVVEILSILATTGVIL